MTYFSNGYDEDGNYRGDDDKQAEGYECKRCGHTPTYYELHRGSCRVCGPLHSKATLTNTTPNNENIDEG